MTHKAERKGIRVVLGEYDTRYETSRFVNDCPSKKVYLMQPHIMKMVLPGSVYGKRFRLVAEILPEGRGK